MSLSIFVAGTGIMLGLIVMAGLLLRSDGNRQANTLLAAALAERGIAVRSLALPVLRHRVLCNYFAESDNMTVDDVLNQMLEQVRG